MNPFMSLRRFAPLLLLATLPVNVLGGDVISTDGFASCQDNPTVQVQKLNVTYNRNTRLLTFDVAGTSEVVQNVTVDLVITAYGQQVYQRTYNPCDSGTKVDIEGNFTSICPIPIGSFAAAGEQTIPEKYASQIPGIAFAIPDLEGDVKVSLLSTADNSSVACIESEVSNGQTFNVPAISYTAAGVAGAALGVSLLTSAVAGSGAGTGAAVSFTTTMGWFQGIATSGMLSVAYPKSYLSFTTNFGFSTGLVQWASMQVAIDNFRKSTGGNLTDDSYQYLKNDATLTYYDGTTNSTIAKRSWDAVRMAIRDGTSITVNGTTGTIGGSSGNGTTNGTSTNTPGFLKKQAHLVSGIEAYVEQLTIPKANTFMTVLLVWAILVGAIIVAILLVKIILEAWSLFGHIPKSLESWRKRYWWRLAKTLTNLILVLYGVWTLYCIYQFTNGDSWAAKLLAGVTLGLFTAVLAGFTWKIYSKAHEYKAQHGDSGGLYQDKETWIKYSLFYDNYKRSYWWIFVPAILYTFARGAIIAGAEGHGLVQCGAQLIVEGLMLTLLLWVRPYERRSTAWISTSIQVVRVISVVCVLVFVEELGISQTTKTITGLILIVVQCVMTGLLAILIAVNALIACIKENPHRRKRKEAEKMMFGDGGEGAGGGPLRLQQDDDSLTSLHPRNSLLMAPMVQRQNSFDTSMYKLPVVSAAPAARYDPVSAASSRDNSPSPPALASRPHNFSRAPRADPEHQRLVSGAAAMGRRRDERSYSPGGDDEDDVERQPRLPVLMK